MRVYEGLETKLNVRVYTAMSSPHMDTSPLQVLVSVKLFLSYSRNSEITVLFIKD